jgi:hypothetical protein
MARPGPDSLSGHGTGVAQIIRVLALIAFSLWLGWNTYRHLAVYLLRGRVVVLTDRALGNLILGVGGIAVILSPFPADAVVLVTILAADLILLRAGIWLVAGASPGRILERAGLVLRGMGFSFDQTGERDLEEQGGRIRIRVAVSAGSGMHVLRLRTARGINKVALFRVNFRKFLVAIPRQRR